METLIPTRYRLKIGAAWSWPTGAEELSAAFANIPQRSLMEITFSDVYAKNHTLAEAQWIEILRIIYFRGNNSISISQDTIDRGWLKPQWSIMVAPVPRTERKLIRDSLLAYYPIVANRLAEAANLHTLGRLTLRIIYDREKNETYCSTEDARQPERARA